MSRELFKEARNALAFSQSLRDKFQQPQYQRPQSPLEMGSLDMEPMPEEPVLPNNQVMDIQDDAPANPLEMGELKMEEAPKKGGFMDFISRSFNYKKPEDAPMKFPIKDRNLEVTDEDLEEARKILFSEVSNRSPERQAFEARIIANTALNRMAQYAERGTPKTLSEVLREPNQYQGLGTPQYELAASGNMDYPSKKKMEVIEAIIEEIKNKGLEDNTDGSVFYIHEPDGAIKLKEGKLFK